MADPVRIAIILGSTREGRVGERIGVWFRNIAEQRDDMIVDFIDLLNVDLPFFTSRMGPASGQYSPVGQAWAARIGPADGYVIISPEYNHGYPAVIKNALDHIYAEWNRKPVAFVGYGGSAGGSRAVEQLRLVAIELQMAPIREGIIIPMARASVSEEGVPADPALNDRATSMLNQLVWWARALRAARAGS